ncbi:PLD nuclease N-terminal domain-containing protein [uncultured Arcobacter sp.]|uniref:PLD nuclease N-terminal domain-containing protein n=1 Tax=uncultured Arcobacter sp. TaxID=165434 RepID=UPI002604F178|nr:PLD nuclease N-terminal domain-containing protein [uncultured Arcobacter sp.]
MGMPGGLEFLIVSVIPLLLLGIYIYILIDILKSEFDGANKLIWLIVVFVLPFVGAILYYFIGRKQKIQKSN